MSGRQKKVLLYSETHNATSHPLEDRDKERTNEKKESTGKERRERDQKKEVGYLRSGVFQTKQKKWLPTSQWSSLGFRGGFPLLFGLPPFWILAFGYCWLTVKDLSYRGLSHSLSGPQALKQLQLWQLLLLVLLIYGRISLQKSLLRIDTSLVNQWMMGSLQR